MTGEPGNKITQPDPGDSETLKEKRDFLAVTDSDEPVRKEHSDSRIQLRRNEIALEGVAL